MVRKSKDFESKIFSFIMTKFLQKVRKLWKFKFNHLTQLFYLKYRVANKKLFLGFCFSNPLIYFQEYQQIKEEVTFSVYLSFLRKVWLFHKILQRYSWYYSENHTKSITACCLYTATLFWIMLRHIFAHYTALFASRNPKYFPNASQRFSGH